VKTKLEGTTVELEEYARRAFASQPFSQLVGAQLLSVGPKQAELSIPIVDHLKQQHGYVHGGVISYLADNSITFAGGLALGGGALTSEFKINYVRPAVGTCLIARAVVRSAGKRHAVCQCDIFAVDNGEETLCAIAQGTVVKVTV
jgi:uncharacterized protein (TIGR00369 family)